MGNVYPECLSLTQLVLIVPCYVKRGLRVRLLCRAGAVQCVPEAPLPIQTLFNNKAPLRQVKNQS